MRYFMDSEFIEDGITIDPISIAIVAEDGRELYFQNAECDFSKASDWVVANVLPHLEGDYKTCTGSDRWKTKKAIAISIVRFLGWFEQEPHFEEGWKPEFWGYYADYDWVLFAQLFGKMIDLPKGFPMYCHDLKQTVDELGNPRLPAQASSEHNALADARWVRDSYLWLKEGFSHPALMHEFFADRRKVIKEPEPMLDELTIALKLSKQGWRHLLAHVETLSVNDKVANDFAEQVRSGLRRDAQEMETSEQQRHDG